MPSMEEVDAEIMARREAEMREDKPWHFNQETMVYVYEATVQIKTKEPVEAAALERMLELCVMAGDTEMNVFSDIDAEAEITGVKRV